MKCILLIQQPDGSWKEGFSGGFGPDSRTKCEDKAFLLGDSVTWMIVGLIRAHHGPELVTIK